MRFTAGRFRADCYVGPANGETTVLIQIDGSGEAIGEMRIRKDELPDVEYVLKRAIAAHGERKP